MPMKHDCIYDEVTDIVVFWTSDWVINVTGG